MHGPNGGGALAQARPRTLPTPAPAEGDLLRFIVCGSVDDGKSTLIGRLLYETGSIPADQLETLAAESRRFGTQGASLDLALLVDGLSAEREQGITIDVAYRFFGTARRKFIVIDAPGHEQYTRNMVTGASQADFGLVLVDARQGLTDQTRRHARLLGLLGFRNFALVVNKMDRVRFLEEAYDEVVAAFAVFAQEEGLGEFTAIPLSGLTGANVTTRSGAMPWYRGPTLLDLLETTPRSEAQGHAEVGFRMPVQLALRPDADFRGFAGTVASGSIAVGDEVVVQPGGQRTTIARIATFDGDLAEARAGQAVVLVLADAVDCARGDVIAAADAPLPLAESFTADLVWLHDRPYDQAREYQLKSATRTVPAELALGGPIKTLEPNDIAGVRLGVPIPVPIDRFTSDGRFGAFILLDAETRATVAAGMVRELSRLPEKRREPRENIVWFDSSRHAKPAAEKARIVAALSATGNRVIAFDDDDLAAELCAGLERSSAEWSRRALAAARLAARGGATILVASTAPVPSGTVVQSIDGAEAIAPDWVI